MRVLITSGVYPPNIGGPARMIKQLVSDLRERGFAVKVLTFGEEKYETGVVGATGKIDFFKKMIERASKSDVIYTFDLYTAGFFSWLIGKKIYHKKLIVRFAGDSAWELASNKGQTNDDLLVFQKHFYGLGVAWHKWLRKRILLGADKVVAVSEFMKKVAMGIGVPEEKIKVIYNSVDFLSEGLNNPYDLSSVDCEALLKQYGLYGSFFILAVGRLVPWKGNDLLIKALARIDDKELKLFIVGEGPDLNRLKQVVEDEGMVGRVKFAGKVPLSEIFKFYALGNIFVLDSQYEGLSHVLLEALGVGKPIIASRSGGNPEVIENEQNGLLVDYGDVDQLVAAIKRMLVEEKWHSTEYKEKCHASLKKFNWKNAVEQTSKIIEELKP